MRMCVRWSVCCNRCFLMMVMTTVTRAMMNSTAAIRTRSCQWPLAHFAAPAQSGFECNMAEPAVCACRATRCVCACVRVSCTSGGRRGCSAAIPQPSAIVCLPPPASWPAPICAAGRCSARVRGLVCAPSTCALPSRTRPPWQSSGARAWVSGRCMPMILVCRALVSWLHALASLPDSQPDGRLKSSVYSFVVNDTVCDRRGTGGRLHGYKQCSRPRHWATVYRFLLLHSIRPSVPMICQRPGKTSACICI